MASVMFLTNEQTMLYVLTETEPWEGDVQAPTGAWTTITIPEAVRAEQAEISGLQIDESVVGSWLIVEDEQGFLHFHKFESERELAKEAGLREAAFEAWDYDPREVG